MKNLLIISCSILGTRHKILLATIVLLCATSESLSAGDEFNFTLKIDTAEKSHEGRPVAWNDHQFIMLRRDGRMLHFQMNEVTDFTKKSPHFSPYNHVKIQRHLQKLFGRRYEVSRTAHYVVVHPPGKRTEWAEPFEKLFQRFSHYFNVRGFLRRSPEFPLVVVVLRSRGEFNDVASSDGMFNPSSYVGYYSKVSNWVVTFQQSSGKQSSGAKSRWDSDHLTLIHEALHQYAFNVGIHNRWAPTPKWCAEGLATMFETRGVNDSMTYNADKDRWHRHYLPYLQAAIRQGEAKRSLRSLVASDRLFEEDISFSYSMAWGLAYYLAETRPGNFNSYLQHVARREPFKEYTSGDRQADFIRYFGNNFEMLESQFQKRIMKQRLR